MLFLFMITLFVPVVHSAGSPSLRIGFYRRSCPAAESIVRRIVRRTVSQNPGIGAGLIRLHFHDYFVRGCDGSVLLKSLPSGPKAERDHPDILRGFNIARAKRRIERVCPNTVSCTDILAFATRDSSQILGRINYPVPAGRRDGIVSSFNEVTQNLPSPRLTADQLIQNFARKGLSADEMVTLSGAHSIGRSRCSSFLAESPATRGYVDVNARYGVAWTVFYQRGCSNSGWYGRLNHVLYMMKRSILFLSYDW
ncbi:unnamed protein product [Linum tenue]|nr:unnamed protein product [Linum tenue]